MKNCINTLFKIITIFGFSVSCHADLIIIDYNVQDTWWWNGTAQTNSTELRTNDVGFSDQRIGVQFNDLTALNSLVIESVELQLYRYSGSWQSDEDMTINAYAATSSWDESSLIPSYYEQEIASTTYTDAEANGWKSWDITELAIAWMQEEVENNGIMLAGIGVNYFQRFYSSEYTGFSPQLVINTVKAPEANSIYIFLLSLTMLLMFSRKARSK